jgi:transposase
MEVIHPSCAGLDVHQKTVVACRMYTGPDKTLQIEKKTFRTMTRDLLSLSDWLIEADITHVAMESTGDYWKSVYNVLEGIVETWVVNASHVKNVPGRKTDVRDATWLCDLMRHGLLRPSFVPNQEQREWRDLTRMRITLVRERASLCNRMHKALESCNIKIGAVASDLLGVSSRIILRELVEKPNATPVDLAGLALGRLREKRDLLADALEGRMNDHHRFMIGQLLDHVTELDRRIDTFEKRIEELSGPFKEAVDLIDSIPGISRTAANAIVSEIGNNMDRFATPAHLASWLGLCPGNNQSGGKRMSGRTRKGNQYARANLVQIAHVVCRMKETQFYSLYRRIASRRGNKRALIAVSHAVVTVVHCLLTTHQKYTEPGPDYFVARNPERELSDLKRRAERMGLELVPAAKAA